MKHTLILLTFIAGSLIVSGCATQSSPPDVNLQASQEGSGAFARLEPQATGTTYYVSGAGDDANTGLSPKEAFRSLQRAADLTNPGDTVLAMNGTYTRDGVNTVVLQISRSGEPDKYIQYRAFPGQTPRIKLNKNSAGIQISAAYIVTEGFTVEGDIPDISAEEALRRALLPADQVAEALRESPFKGGGIFAYPVDGRYPHHLIVRKNHVFNCPGTGISSNGSDYIRIENNLVHNNSYYNPNANSGISFYQSRDTDDYTGAKIFIRGNVTYRNENKVPFWFSNSDPSKRRITDGNGIIIDDNRSTQTAGGTPYQGKTVIENNLAYDNGGRGINIFESDNIEIRNNTTYKNARTVSTAIGSEFALGNVGNVQVVRNLMVARPDRKVVNTYNTSNVTFTDNLFLGGNGEGELPAGVQRNVKSVANLDPARAADLRDVQKAFATR